MRFHFHELAMEDYENAISWYLRRSLQAAGNFEVEVDAAVERIIQRPLAFPLVEDECRRALLHRYPYALIFRAAPEAITIIAVAHTSRRPGYWSDRQVSNPAVSGLF